MCPSFLRSCSPGVEPPIPICSRTSLLARCPDHVFSEAHTPRLTPEGAFTFPSSSASELRLRQQQGSDSGSARAGRVPRGGARRGDAGRRGPTCRTYVPPRRSEGCRPRRRPLGGGPGRRRRPCLWRAASRRTTRTSSTMCLSTSTGAGWPPAPAIRASRCARLRGEGGGAAGTDPDRGARDPQPRTPPRRKRRGPSPPADCGVTAARARGVVLPRLRGAALDLGALGARAGWACGVGHGCGSTRLGWPWASRGLFLRHRVSHFCGSRLCSFAQDTWDSLKG